MPIEPTVDMTMMELIEAWPAAADVLAARGMACVGCSMARFETIGEAAAAYGFDAADLLQEVRRTRVTGRVSLTKRRRPSRWLS